MGSILEDNQPLKLTDFGMALRKIRQRRRYLWVVILAYLPTMWTTLQLSQSYKVTAAVFVIWVILLSIFATVAACARCPRCGNYFHMHGMTLLYLRKCLHCQLHINAKENKTDQEGHLDGNIN
jgi:hypothetical protein